MNIKKREAWGKRKEKKKDELKKEQSLGDQASVSPLGTPTDRGFVELLWRIRFLSFNKNKHQFPIMKRKDNSCQTCRRLQWDRWRGTEINLLKVEKKMHLNKISSKWDAKSKLK